MPEREAAVIRLATPVDASALAALEARYYIGNLPPESRANGFISVQHSADWFAAAVRSAGIHVAEIAGDLVGFIVVTEMPRRADTQPGSISRAMADLTEATSLRGRLVVSQRVACRGPVLIAE